MFGKKNKDGAAADKPAKTKKAKKSKAKSAEGQSRFGDGGIKALLANNIEKMGLAAVAATALYVVFSSYSTPGLDTSKQPDQLGREISNAESNISASTWDQVSQLRYQSPDNYETRASSDVQPVKVTDYPMPQPFEPVKFGLPKKRIDAELISLKDLEVVLGAGAIATQEQTAQRVRLSDDGGGPTLTDEEMKVLRELPEETSNYVGRLTRSVQVGPETKLESRRFVCLLGLLPLKEQYEKYKEAYQDANGFDPDRDFPRYTEHFQVERAEVKTDGSLTAWKLIWGATKKTSQQRVLEEALVKYCYRVQPVEEIARNDAVHPARFQMPTWSQPLPALIHRDFAVFKHSKIKTQLEMDEELNQQDMSSMQGVGNVFEQPQGGMDGGGGYGGGGYGGGGYGGGGYGGGGYGGGGYGGGGGDGVAPRGGGGYGGYGGGGYGGGGGGYGGGDGVSPRGGGGYGGGGGGYGGYGGGGGGYGGAGGGGGELMYDDETGEVMLTIEEKMFRFFDFSVKSGKTYRYRVRLALEDPNAPLDIGRMPPVRFMKKEVADRIKAQAAAAPKGQRVFWRLSDWSQPSPPIAVGAVERILAGKVSRPRFASIKSKGKTLQYPRSTEPTVDTFVIGFDEEIKGDIPGAQQLRRGAVTNFRKTNIEMLDPKLMRLRTRKEHVYNSGMMLVDIDGGTDIAGRKGESLKAPGQILMLTADGRLTVHNELEDAEEYAYNNFPKAEKTDTGYGGAGGDNGGYGAGGGYGGGGGRRGRRGANGY